jgi:hypothetical protein
MASFQPEIPCLDLGIGLICWVVEISSEPLFTLISKSLIVLRISLSVSCAFDAAYTSNGGLLEAF